MGYQYIYIQNEVPKHGYQVLNGSITNVLNEKDSFVLSGKDFIFGVPELLLREEDGSCRRLFSVRTESPTDYREITLETVKKKISQHDSGFHLVRTIAETLIELDKFHIQKKKELDIRKNLSQEYAKIYAYYVDTIGEEFSKRKHIKWLEELYKALKNSLTYTKGKALVNLDSSAKLHIESNFDQLDNYTKRFNANSYICQQGDDGNELYILRKGKIRVFINDQPISVIEKEGSIIGEMIFLIGGERTASMQAIEDTSLAVIKKEDLEKILLFNPNFLKTLSLNLSRRIYHHCINIEKINSELKNNLSVNNVEREDLREAKNQLSSLYLKHKEEWLDQLLNDLTDRIFQVEKID